MRSNIRLNPRAPDGCPAPAITWFSPTAETPDRAPAAIAFIDNYMMTIENVQRGGWRAVSRRILYTERIPADTYSETCNG